jgi:hypothetical protein
MSMVEGSSYDVMNTRSRTSKADASRHEGWAHCPAKDVAAYMDPNTPRKSLEKPASQETSGQESLATKTHQFKALGHVKSKWPGTEEDSQI